MQKVFLSESSNDFPQVAVFDLDGTLLAGDSTFSWLSKRLIQSPFRLLGVLLMLLPSLFMMRIPMLRKIGASIPLWIATVGCAHDELRASFEAFVRSFDAGEVSLQWRTEGVTTLERHLLAGDRVIVVTAAPALLARELLARWKDDVTVFGSTLKYANGGWVGDCHCHGVEKCRILSERGVGSHWAYAYSDSYDDMPILAAAESAYVINAGLMLRRRLRNSPLSNIRQIRWK